MSESPASVVSPNRIADVQWEIGTEWGEVIVWQRHSTDSRFIWWMEERKKWGKAASYLESCVFNEIDREEKVNVKWNGFEERPDDIETTEEALREKAETHMLHLRNKQ